MDSGCINHLILFLAKKNQKLKLLNFFSSSNATSRQKVDKKFSMNAFTPQLKPNETSIKRN